MDKGRLLMDPEGLLLSEKEVWLLEASDILLECNMTDKLLWRASVNNCIRGRSSIDRSLPDSEEVGIGLRSEGLD